MKGWNRGEILLFDALVDFKRESEIHCLFQSFFYRLVSLVFIFEKWIFTKRVGKNCEKILTDLL